MFITPAIITISERFPILSVNPPYKKYFNINTIIIIIKELNYD